jgi:signal transduction protein with GAF and PtsI domain
MQSSSIYSFPSQLGQPAPGVICDERAIRPLLDLGLAESNSQGAYVHVVNLPSSTVRLAVASGLTLSTPNAPDLHGHAVGAHFARTAPLVLHERAWKHPGLELLPEFRANEFEGVVSIPLLDAGRVTGLLNVCRTHAVAFRGRELSFLLSLGEPIGALLAASSARSVLEREVEKLTQQLADRKLLERAKGLVQSRFAWTEEQAYFCIRNLSRRRRTPMRHIAREIIATAASNVAEQDGHYAA